MSKSYRVSETGPLRIHDKPVVPGETKINIVDRIIGADRGPRDPLEVTDGQLPALLRLGHVVPSNLKKETASRNQKAKTGSDKNASTGGADGGD